MSTRSERPTQGQSVHPETSASTDDSRSSAPPREPVCPKSARSALSECVGAISLVQVTVHSLEAQDIACSEQDVLNRAIQLLWSLHDWIHDRTWSDAAAERGREWERQS